MLATALVLIVVISPFVHSYWTEVNIRTSALFQAEQAKKIGDVDLALRHLDRYLTTKPEDLQVLEVKAKILGDMYLSKTQPVPMQLNQALEAAGTLDLLVRLDPKGEGRLVTRRNLAEFYIRYSDELKRVASRSLDPDFERKQSRFPAAASIARQLLDDAEARHETDPVAHRLLARAYEGQISDLRGKSAFVKGDPGKVVNDSKDPEAEDMRLRAIEHYQTAIELDPHDLESSARLANLYATWTKDLAAADAVLDAMLKANPDSVEARMVRYRSFNFANREFLTQDEIEAREKLAQAELEKVLTIDPNNVEIRINVAQVALNRRDWAEARRQLDAIPQAKQDDLRVKIIRGTIEFAEEHPDHAIDEWRRGLQIVGGTDQDLTWRLAYNLVQLGRYAEAEPLRQQYNRLAKGDRYGLGMFLDALFDMGYGKLYDARKKLDKIKEAVSRFHKMDVLLVLGHCCDLMGDSDAALLAYRNAAAASPSATQPRMALARHLQKRHPNEAIEELDQALSEAPKEPFLLLEAIHLRLLALAARSSADSKRLREIEDLFTRVEAVAPENPTLFAYRADYLALSGQLRKAVELLTKAVQGAGRNRLELWVSLSQGLERLNQRNEAIQTLEQASLPENLGDRVKIRIAKARLLARSGKGQAAREVLTKNSEAISVGERPELVQARAELLRELGDRDGAIAAYAEWAKLAPKVPAPALSLLAMAQSENDDRAAKLGLEALKSIGGDHEPYGIAAEALSKMRPDPLRPGPPSPSRLHDAEMLVKTLQREVPSLRLGFLLQGMVLEYKKDLEGAAKAYAAALREDIISPALPKLIEVFIKLKRFDELTNLKREFDREVEARQQPGLALEFDRIATAVSVRLGDKDRADYYASRLIQERRDNVSAVTAYAWMLDRNNEPVQAENSLKELVREKPNDPNGWLALIQIQANHKATAEVARTIDEARKKCKNERPDLFIAQCYWMGRDLPKASEAFRKTLELHPDDLITLRSAVDYYENTNQGDLMEPILRKALKIDPSSTWAARFLAIRLTARPDPATWPEAWSLVAPGSSTSGESPEDRFVRARVLARSPEAGRREEAVQAFLNLANDLPVSSPLAIDTRLKLAQTMIEVGRFAQAWDAVRPVADDQARPNPLGLMLAVEALSRSKQPEEAQRRLDRLSLLDPKSIHIPLSNAWILMARGKKEEAISALETAYNLSASAPNAEALGMLALDRMIRFGDVETSLRVAKKVSERWPADSWALAWVHVLRNEFDLALAVAEKGLEAGSPRESLRFATMAALKNRVDGAFVQKVADLAVKARRKDPRDYNIPILLAPIYHIQDRYEEELNCYREALELYPSNVQFLNNMAWTLSEGLHRPQEAIKYIQEAIQREGEFPQHLDTRGVIEERLGQFDQAIADLEKSAKADPIPATYFHLARAYLKANKPDDSRRCRELAIKANFDPTVLDPTDRTDLKAVMGTP